MALCEVKLWHIFKPAGCNRPRIRISIYKCIKKQFGQQNRAKRNQTNKSIGCRFLPTIARHRCITEINIFAIIGRRAMAMRPLHTDSAQFKPCNYAATVRFPPSLLIPFLSLFLCFCNHSENK